MPPRASLIGWRLRKNKDASPQVGVDMAKGSDFSAAIFGAMDALNKSKPNYQFTTTFSPPWTYAPNSPSKAGKYIVTVENLLNRKRRTSTAWWSKDGWTGYNRKISEITAWKPLPEPAKK